MLALRQQLCAKPLGGGSGSFPPKLRRIVTATSFPGNGISQTSRSEGIDAATSGLSTSASDATSLPGRHVAQRAISAAMVSEAIKAATKTKTERMIGSETAILVFPVVGRPPQLRGSLEEVSPFPSGLPSKPRARPFSLSHSTCARLQAREMQGSPWPPRRRAAVEYFYLGTCLYLFLFLFFQREGRQRYRVQQYNGSITSRTSDCSEATSPTEHGGPCILFCTDALF